MKALLWKDWCVNQFVLIVGTVLLFLPYLIFLILVIYSLRQGSAVHVNMIWEYGTMKIFGNISLTLSLLTIAMLGGNAMAAERADRSAEFLLYLPPSRRSLITSKIILAVGASLVIWIVNLLILLVVAPRLPGAPPLVDGALWQAPGDGMLFLGVTAVLFFGVAWLASSFMASPAIATSCGLLAPAVVGGILGSIHYLHRFPFPKWYNSLGLTVGILGFIAGTVVYLRRFAP